MYILIPINGGVYPQKCILYESPSPKKNYQEKNAPVALNQIKVLTTYVLYLN